MAEPSRIASGISQGTGISSARAPTHISTGSSSKFINTRYFFAPISASKPAVRDAEGSVAKAPKPGKESGRGLVKYSKPRRTVRLLEGTPCYLPGCPTWIKAPSLWCVSYGPSACKTDAGSLPARGAGDGPG